MRSSPRQSYQDVTSEDGRGNDDSIVSFKDNPSDVLEDSGAPIEQVMHLYSAPT